MATETMPRNAESENSEALINAQLQRTRAQVKGVEFGQRVLKLVVGVLVFFLGATLLDHWVVSEGLPIWARVILWLTLIGGVVWYGVKALLPLLLLHVGGAIFTSWRHRENLVASMVHGRKPAPGPTDIT